jgi:hypothetical protein
MNGWHTRIARREGAETARGRDSRDAAVRTARDPSARTALALLVALIATLTVLVATAPRAAAFVSGDELWRRAYDGTGHSGDLAYDLVLAPGGTAVYVTGSMMPSGAVKSDVAVIKYKAGGSRAWRRTYDGAAHGNDEGDAVVCDRSGNVYVGGFTDTATHGQDFLLIKYDAAGHRTWVRTFGGSANGDDAIKALALDAKGNVYAAGVSIPLSNNPSRDATLVKWTPTGRRAWVRAYDGPVGLDDEFRDLAIDTVRGRVYAAGVVGIDPTRPGWLLTRYSTAGTRAWAQTYSVANTANDCTSVALAPGGTVVQAGNAGQTAVHRYDALVKKWTPAGAVSWSASYPGADSDGFADVAVDRQGGVFAVGFTLSGLGNEDALICRVTPSGLMNSEITLGGLGDDRFAAVACDAAGHVYATGYVGTTPYKRDWITAKLSNDLGTVLWQPRARENDVACDDMPAAIAVRTGTNAGVYVTGRGSQTAATWDWLTIKYKP